MRLKRVCLALISCLFFSQIVFAADNNGKYAIGLNYPGITLRHFSSGQKAWEVKIQSETDILAAGYRRYRYSDLKENDKVQIIKGFEFDLFSFNGSMTGGYGIAAGIFYGGEYAVSRGVSLQLDFGPTLLFLMDQVYTDVNLLGLEFVLNIGVNFYLGGK